MKLLASDFDNTLWFHDHMKERDVKTIKEFQKQGNLFGVCTGRCLQGIVNPSQPYNLEHDFYILLSGALILNSFISSQRDLQLFRSKGYFHCLSRCYVQGL